MTAPVDVRVYALRGDVLLLVGSNGETQRCHTMIPDGRKAEEVAAELEQQAAAIRNLAAVIRGER